MSDQAKICPQCSEPLTSEAPGGLCPRCVMRMNLMPDTLPGTPGATPTVADLAPHFPHLEILECLGRGGMGIVYKARQPQLDRLVALKILAPERVDDLRFAERFRREGVSLARLDHPNIVTVFDTGESGGYYYLLMEFVDGLNLREAIAGEKMPPQEALAIVPLICAGLQYAHEQGVVHRDIKPENILLDKKGRVKIADFGVAKLVCGPEDAVDGTAAAANHDPGLTLGGKLGTPQYMAPEQEAKSGLADHRSDIYALGVVFYEMLTGERPAKDVIAPSDKVQIDVRIDEIVLRALEKEPERRYQTAGEFGTVVETVAASARSSEDSVRDPFSSRNLRRRSGLAPSRPGMEPRFSRLAIVGACSAMVLPLGLVLNQFAALTTAGTHGVWSMVAGASGMPMIAIGLAFLIGATILGWIAVSQIRRSAGRLHGLELAVFDGLLFPLLMLAALWWVLWYGLLDWAFPLLQMLGIHKPSTAFSLVVWIPWLAISIWIGIRATRKVWRMLVQPATGETQSTLSPITHVGIAKTPRKDRMVLAGVGISVAVLMTLLSLFFWVQRPQKIDKSGIFAESPDGMFSAEGFTCRAMRVFDSDSTFYYFIVQGRAGTMFEKWEVPVPYDKLATNYIGLSIDEILFGKHGSIVWSEDSKRVSFRVNGIEVSGFDTDTRKLTEPTGLATTPRTPYAAELPDGSFVEIVSLLYAGSSASRNPKLSGWFWQADGSDLAVKGEADWSFTPALASRTTPIKEGIDTRGIVVRWGGPSSANPTLLGWEFNGRPGSDGSFHVNPRNESTRNWLGLISDFPTETQTATLRFKLATGPFAAGPTPSRVWGNSDATPYGSFLMGAVFDRNGTAAINLTHDLHDCDFRVRARRTGDPSSGMVGKFLRKITNEQEGRSEPQWVIGRRVDGRSDGGQVLEVYEFPGLAPHRGLILGLEVRPSQWVEIRNVSLNPGTPTHPEVIVSAAAPAGSKTVGRSPEVLTFGPERQVSLNDCDVKAEALDFETGRVLAVPEEAWQPLETNNADWFVKSGAELLTDSKRQIVGLITIRSNALTLVKLANEEWQSMTPAQLGKALKRDSSGINEMEMGFGKVYVLSATTPAPVTLGFRTSIGTEGVLQASWPEEVEQKAVTIRYKLVAGAVSSEERTTSSRQTTPGILPPSAGDGIELLALANYPTAGSPWWTPEGLALTEPPVDPTDIDIRSHLDANHIWLTALFRVPGGLDPVLGGDSIQRADDGRWLGAGRQFHHGQPVDDLVALAIAFPADEKQADLAIRLAHGAWRTTAVVDAGPLLAKGESSEGDSVLRIKDQSAGDLTLTVEHPQTNVQARVAIQRGEQTIFAEPVYGAAQGTAGARIVAWRFKGVESDSIDRFILQTRPSERVEFRNVALQRGLPPSINAAKESIPAFGSGDSVLIWHWNGTPEPLTVYVMEDRIFDDPAPLLARLAGLYRQQPFAAVPVRLGPAGWAETEGLKVVRELENGLRATCPARLTVGEALSELPLEMDDGLYSVTVPAWDINKDSALNLDDGTLNQTKPPLSLDFSKPETLKAWRRMGFDAYVPPVPGSDMLMLPTLPAMLVPAADEWERSEIAPRALMQKIASLAGRARDQKDSGERPVTALFAGDPTPGWLLTDYGSLLLVKVEKDGDDPGALKVSWRRTRQATLHGEASSLPPPPSGSALGNTPEQVARAFMDALAALDVEQAMAWVEKEKVEQWRRGFSRNARELVKVYGKDLERLRTFTEWHRQDSYAVARVATPIPADGTRSLFLILADTPEGWRVVDLDDIQDPATLPDKLARFLKGQRAKRVP